ncbi:MAG: hypothetical protein AAB289_05020 [Chloroflexota bacterium]
MDKEEVFDGVPAVGVGAILASTIWAWSHFETSVVSRMLPHRTAFTIASVDIS